MKPLLRWSILLVIVVAGLGAMHYFAPLQPCSVVVDLAIVAVLAGVVSIVRPLRFLSIQTRRNGGVVALVGVLAGVAALNWPAPLQRVAEPATTLDRFLPAYHVNEVHSVLVRATPGRAYQAAKQVTFSDLRVFAALMQIRLVASGRFVKAEAPPVPILDALNRPESGFIPLSDEPGREIVMGVVGRFWANERRPRIGGAPEYLAFTSPGYGKVAFNIRIEPLDGGWCRVSSETRGIGTDDAARNTFVRYWRVIYPGSGAIRRMWMNAIKSRAEAMGV